MKKTLFVLAIVAVAAIVYAQDVTSYNKDLSSLVRFTGAAPNVPALPAKMLDIITATAPAAFPAKALSGLLPTRARLVGVYCADSFRFGNEDITRVFGPVTASGATQYLAGSKTDLENVYIVSGNHGTQTIYLQVYGD